MSKYIDADKLIHDLEERIFAYSEGYAEGDDNRKDAIETLLKDVKYQYSLQQEQPEKPVPNDLEEAAEEYKQGEIDTNVDYHDETGEPLCFMEALKPAFIAGAKWQYQKDRGKFAQIKAKTWCEGFDACKEQDEKELSEKIAGAYQLGLADKEKQMMKEAVETEVTETCGIASVWIKTKQFKPGQKVRIIIVKED